MKAGYRIYNWKESCIRLCPYIIKEICRDINRILFDFCQNKKYFDEYGIIEKSCFEFSGFSLNFEWLNFRGSDSGLSMATDRDYYEILGVSRDATQDQLKEAFRNLARKYHPDVNKAPDAEEKFKEINEAYQVLSNPDTRSAYDRYGKSAVSGSAGGYNYADVDLSDILGDLFGFGNFGGFGSTRSSAQSRNIPRRGSDLQTTVNLQFEEAVMGADKEISFARDEKCTRCNGTGCEPGTSKVTCPDCHGTGEKKVSRQTMFGSMVQVVTCPTCNGRGEVVKSPCTSCHGRGTTRQVIKKTVAVPAGVDNGTRIRLAGEGQPGSNGGPSGDLYIDVKVSDHKFFRRNDSDIQLNININVAQAALGTEIDVPTVTGSEKLRIPAGTQPGKVFTLKGKGIPHLRDSGKGDEQVVVNVVIPVSLSDEQRSLFEQMGKTLGTDTTPQEKGFWDRLKGSFNG